MISWVLLVALLAYVSLLVSPKKTFKMLGVISAPFVNLYIKRRISAGLEDENRFNERFGIPSKERPNGKLVWIHAVSVGEMLSVIPIIKQIKSENDNITVLLTTTTLTAAKQVEEKLKDLVIHQYMPFDVTKWISRFVKYWKPSLVLFVESELWPNTLYYLHENNIPVYLLNVRISNRSLNRMKLAKKYFKILPFSLFQAVYTSSKSLQQDLKDLGAKDVVIVPNMKTISTKLSVNQTNSDAIKSQISKRNTWMVVSTHPGEEEIIIAAHKLIKQALPNILTIIAIRHPARSDSVLELCNNLNLSATTYTKSSAQLNLTEDIYIVDKIGCLGDFFDNIKTVLVGGSLIPNIGGHNILEPLQFNCDVATGPYIDNFKDIYNEFKDYCKILTTPDEISRFVIESISSDHTNSVQINLNAREVWNKIINDMINHYITN